MKGRRPKRPAPALNEERVASAIDGVLFASEPSRELTHQLLRGQRELRQAVDDAGWEAYLRLEEIGNERTTRLVEGVIAWAYAEGLRARQPHRRKGRSR